jgi:hypothetical protein
VTASLRRTVVVTMAALGVAFLMVWSATTGPVGVVEAASPGTVTQTTPEGRQAADTDAKDDQEQAATDAGTGGSLLPWVRDLAVFAGVVGTLWILGAGVHALLERIGRDLPSGRLVLDLAPLSVTDAGRESMARDLGRQREILAGTDVRNAVVGCWVRLEEAAGEAGVVRGPAETSTELVVRFLHVLDVDPRPVGRLAGLYHEARFSTHPLGDAERDEARGCLERIHADLSVLRS